MKSLLKSSIGLICIPLFALYCGAQVVVPVSSLPNVIGEYNVSYVRTNLDLTPLLGSPGSNFWDFSQAPTADDMPQQLNIVPVSDGGNGDSFPDATYAQRFTGGIYAAPTWEYYQTSNGIGRSYFGYYSAQNTLVDPIIAFPEPTIDLPDPIQYGQSWDRKVAYQIFLTLGGAEDIEFSESASVDAFGTLALPGFGPLPALRFTAIDTYDISFSGIDFGTETDTNYVWLVPGIGFAAEAIQYGASPLGGAPSFTNYFQRVFLNPPVSPGPTVSLGLQAATPVLNWQPAASGSGYVIWGATNLSLTNWLPVAQLTNQSFAVPINPGVSAQFFKVTVQP